MKNVILIVCVAVIVGLGSAVMAADIETVTILPTADGTTYYDHRVPRITAHVDGFTINASSGVGDSDEFRGAIEFNVSSVPSQLLSASLVLNIQHVMEDAGVADVPLLLYAYPGDGVISPQDFYARFDYGPFSQVEYQIGAVDLPPMPPQWVSDVFVEVDALPALMFAQEQSWSYLGFMLRRESAERVYIGSLESPASPVVGEPAELVYETPEPATLSLLSLGGLVVIRRRRRRE